MTNTNTAMLDEITLDEVGRISGLSLGALRARIREGSLVPSRRIGNALLFPKDTFVERKRKPKEAPL